ncbi:hypothetical protein DFP92_1315 [Yoonia sediminilitoris]|uniref:Uncharacterized protein n=1 Tax=Yoonia sediminilitoris TaxID=1286148 RepID=A0A2T6K458_9RHOB|nr:hypothetical protein C8N45_1315 [Yoonia sediminilitoris]RCW89473.1 hypothetical protein DFP92_1315 [Yoonia sediminilitoris]
MLRRVHFGCKGRIAVVRCGLHQWQAMEHHCQSFSRLRPKPKLGFFTKNNSCSRQL